MNPSPSAAAAAGRRWFLLALALLFVGLSVLHGYKATRHRSAILRWQPQLLALADGEDISQRYNYPNPPVMAVLLYPLAKLPPLAAALVWFYLKLGLTVVAVLWVFRLVETPERPFPAWAKALTVLLSLRPIMGDLQHGNVNLFILFLVVAFLTAFRRGRDLLAGVVLALGIACKLTPALFVPYLIWKRAWRALAGCVLGLGLFLWPGLVPALALGWDENRHQLASWYADMVRPFVVEGQVTSEHINQSLPGVACRLLTHSPSFSTWVNDVYTPLEYHNLLDLPRDTVRLLVKGCMGLFALLVVVCCRTPTQPRQSWRLAAEGAVIVLGMLLFSERTWKHHCVTLLLPFAVLCYCLAACQPGRGLRAYLIGTLAAATLLIASTSSALAGGRLADLAEVYGPYLAAHLLLLAALAVLLCRRGRDGAASGGYNGDVAAMP
jgi:hypothetical protein